MNSKPEYDRGRTLGALAIVLVGLLAWSGLHPYDRATWVLEVFPVVLGLPVLWATYRRYPLTPLLYGLLFAHAIILMVGGKYTYARVPLGFEMAKLLGIARNPYDKIGHFFQGFVPAMVAREIFIRGRHVRGDKMRVYLVLSVVLSISAAYELFEWACAVTMGQGADEFLGTQGDPWDTQSDMLFAVIGSVAALVLLSRLHDRLLARMGFEPSAR